ncbi:hypothetical protein Tco_0505359 [Tanacetum coccineum]
MYQKDTDTGNTSGPEIGTGRRRPNAGKTVDTTWGTGRKPPRPSGEKRGNNRAGTRGTGRNGQKGPEQELRTPHGGHPHNDIKQLKGTRKNTDHKKQKREPTSGECEGEDRDEKKEQPERSAGVRERARVSNGKTQRKGERPRRRKTKEQPTHGTGAEGRSKQRAGHQATKRGRGKPKKRSPADTTARKRTTEQGAQQKEATCRPVGGIRDTAEVANTKPTGGRRDSKEGTPGGKPPIGTRSREEEDNGAGHKGAKKKAAAGGHKGSAKQRKAPPEAPEDHHKARTTRTTGLER